MSTRMDKVNQLLLTELAPVLEAYTVEVGGLVTITYVKTSPDLAQAIIGVSCYHTDREADDIIVILNRNARLFHKEISSRIKLKKVPKLEFRLDNTGEYAEHIDKLFQQIKQEKDSLKSEEDSPS